MKKIVVLSFLGLVLSFSSTVQAQYYSFCVDPILSLKGGVVINGDWLVGVESRCDGQDGGLFSFSGIDYNTAKTTTPAVAATLANPAIASSSIRFHNISAGGGMGYNFTDVLGVADLHPFVGLGMLLSTTITKGDLTGYAGIQVPVGADYLVTESLALGVEYAFNHLWNFEDSNLSGPSHKVMFRLSFWM